ncbi:MAG: type I-A CRISPR-associated protein Cas4/Csa1, partial [Thermoprotei archaeon]
GELTSLLQEGIMVHKVFHAAVMDVMRELVLGHKGWEAYEKIASSAEARLSELGIDIAKRPWMLDLYKQLVMAWCSEEWAGLFAEYRVDGSPLGLSRNLRVDGLAEGGVVLEIKYGRPLEFHKVALAGYALALEADLEVPFDYGILVYVKNYNGHASFEWDPIYVSPELRKAFIDARDEVIDMLISGREPPKALNCPSSCPFRGVCT